MTSTVARPHTASHLGLGRKGEQLAAQHLQKLGFVVLSRNWRCREGEIDVVATDGRTLVVCEVKSRAGADFGDPAEAVTEEKIARIRRITGQWLRTFNVRWCPVRFDVVAVLALPSGEFKLRHVPGAF
ncbi:MAG TPA: YraN family protein [Amycolatopsis sp.]|nr:YraN family protein [Amycolatopsis sp.]